jgi:hypothetical protein
MKRASEGLAGTSPSVGGNFPRHWLSWTKTRNRVRTLIRNPDRLAETSHG